MSRIRVADLHLLAFFVGAVAFTVWESLAVLPQTPIHTISYLAHEHIWFRLLIAVVLPVTFGLWFWDHSGRFIPK